MLSPAQRLLSELHSKPEWQEILSQINQDSRPVRYKASTSDPEDKKINQMIYHSGRQDEKDRILKLLSGEDNE